jgi:hypothetical protein
MLINGMVKDVRKIKYSLIFPWRNFGHDKNFDLDFVDIKE